MMVALLAATSIAKAQDTYLNDRLTATDDVIGTARYVGMGGAMGALGADLSVISSNPAGLGLYRKSDIGLTFGAIIPNKANGWDPNDAGTKYEKLARASFDQAGFLYSMNTGDDKLKFVNFAFNFQKKANYNMGFYADNASLNGLSQMDQITELAMEYHDPTYWCQNLQDKAVEYQYVTDNTGKIVANNFRGINSKYTRHQWGSLQSFDFNASFNVNDRFYTGLTIGLDNVEYSSWSTYFEANTNGVTTGDYSLYNEREIDGFGVNVKMGFIVRPIETSPFRIGFAVETPTWYRMKNRTFFDLTDELTGQHTSDNPSDDPISSLEYAIRTPWRARLSMGSTVDKFLAWGIEYEYANAASTKMGYPKWADDGNHNAFASTKDVVMNGLTRSTLRAQHTLKMGLEVKPIDALALRVGYNFVSSRYKDNPTFDQYDLNSYSMEYATSTDYMTFGPANIVTFGLGFKHKKFYADLAYKYRVQNAKFYAFDTSFTTASNSFITANPTLEGATLDPVDVNLYRHQLMLSLGFKF